MNCRHCKSKLEQVFVDLGTAPPSNAYLTSKKLHEPELWYPLRVLVCNECWLVQTEDFAKADELFDADYAYFSSFSSSWLKHAETYANQVIDRFHLGQSSRVVEIAANDGYLLQYFKSKQIPCLGVEPTRSTAAAARAKGIPIVEEFFGRNLAERLLAEHGPADLMIANNVLAHVPDINDFVAGFAKLLSSSGVATFEFPHVAKLVEDCQFDTIYHEHFSYLSLTAVETIFKSNGLEIFDVEEISTHGGSLRLFAQKKGDGLQPNSSALAQLRDAEMRTGINSRDYYCKFQEKANKIKNELLKFLLAARESGKTVVAYGAAAKGNTLLNYGGIRSDLVKFVVDKNPSKQDKFLPGSRIPVVGIESLEKVRPDYVLILPWNLEKEIVSQLEYVKDWGARFVIAVPNIRTI